MDGSTISIRLMKPDDFAAVVKIDGKELKTPRPDYYRLKFEELVQSTDRLPTSLVAIREDGTVVGFVMGVLFIGEYGISNEATLDTIGVDPDYRDWGIGRALISQLLVNLMTLRVEQIRTEIDWRDRDLLAFLDHCGFRPAPQLCFEHAV